MKIGAGKVIGAVMFAAGVAAIWLWPKPKAVALFKTARANLAVAKKALESCSLVADPFYSAMAVTIMCGLAFATLFTMVVVPVNYALLHGVRR